MYSLIIMNYLEQMAKNDEKLQYLLQRLAEFILELQSLNEQNLENENVQLTMNNINFELIGAQFEEFCTHQKETVAAVRESHVLAWRTFEQLKQISWHKLIGYDVQQMHCEYQLELQQFKQRYERKRELYQQMEERHIIQELRKKQNELKQAQAELETAKNSSKTLMKSMGQKLAKVEEDRNVKLVQLLKTKKEVDAINWEIDRIENPKNICHPLELKKQTLSDELKLREFQRPLSDLVTKVQPSVPQSADNFDPRVKILNPLKMDIKLLPVKDYFNIWEQKWQQERVQNVLPKAPEETNNLQPLPRIERKLSKEELKQASEPNNIQSLARKECKSSLQESPAVETANLQLIPRAEGLSSKEMLEHDQIKQADGKVHNNEKLLLQGIEFELEQCTDTSIVDLCSQKQEDNDQMMTELVIEETDRENETDDNVATNEANNRNEWKTNKPKIDIQECRIIKPAGTALPKALPIELSPENKNSTPEKTNFIAPVAKPKKQRRSSRNSRDDFFEQLLQFSSDQQAIGDENLQQQQNSEMPETAFQLDTVDFFNMNETNEAEEQNSGSIVNFNMNNGIDLDAEYRSDSTEQSVQNDKFLKF